MRVQAALEDLVKAPSNKLFPFVKLLLAENSLLQSSAAAAEPNGFQVCHLVLTRQLEVSYIGRLNPLDFPGYQLKQLGSTEYHLLKIKVQTCCCEQCRLYSNMAFLTASCRISAVVLAWSVPPLGATSPEGD